MHYSAPAQTLPVLTGGNQTSLREDIRGHQLEAIRLQAFELVLEKFNTANHGTVEEKKATNLDRDRLLELRDSINRVFAGVGDKKRCSLQPLLDYESQAKTRDVSVNNIGEISAHEKLVQEVRQFLEKKLTDSGFIEGSEGKSEKPATGTATGQRVSKTKNSSVISLAPGENYEKDGVKVEVGLPQTKGDRVELNLRITLSASAIKRYKTSPMQVRVTMPEAGAGSSVASKMNTQPRIQKLTKSKKKAPVATKVSKTKGKKAAPLTDQAKTEKSTGSRNGAPVDAKPSPVRRTPSIAPPRTPPPEPEASAEVEPKKEAAGRMVVVPEQSLWQRFKNNVSAAAATLGSSENRVNRARALLAGLVVAVAAAAYMLNSGTREKEGSIPALVDKDPESKPDSPALPAVETESGITQSEPPGAAVTESREVFEPTNLGAENERPLGVLSRLLPPAPKEVVSWELLGSKGDEVDPAFTQAKDNLQSRLIAPADPFFNPANLGNNGLQTDIDAILARRSARMNVSDEETKEVLYSLPKVQDIPAQTKPATTLADEPQPVMDVSGLGLWGDAPLELELASLDMDSQPPKKRADDIMNPFGLGSSLAGRERFPVSQLSSGNSSDSIAPDVLNLSNMTGLPTTAPGLPPRKPGHDLSGFFFPNTGK